MRLIIISGRSGSGKSTALNQLEDDGFYCIDNLPAALLPALCYRAVSGELSVSGVAVCIDARNAKGDIDHFPALLERLPDVVDADIIYLDAEEATLIKRFSETRRRHPLSNEGTTLAEAIAGETRILDAISSRATLTMDTSNMTIYELRTAVRERVIEKDRTELSVLFQSFGFKRGVPGDADIVYDVRVLPNPHWEKSLRTLSGLDEDVRRFLEQHELVHDMYRDICSYLDNWLPHYQENNRSYITIAIGCTGGQHRSVYLAQRLYERYCKEYPEVKIRHRELQT